MRKFSLVAVFLFVATVLEARLPDLIPYRKGDLWGYVDSTKKIIIEPVYDNVEFFEFGRAVVQKKGKQGVIDPSGKTVIPFLYNELEAGLVSGYWRARLMGNKFGIIDSTNKFSVPAIYNELQWCGGPYVVSRDNSEARIMSVYNQEIVRYASSAADAFPVFVPKRNVFIVQSSGKFGVINLKGAFVVPAMYDNITCHPCGYYSAEQSGRSIVFDKKGKKKRKLPKACCITPSTEFGDRVVPGQAWISDYNDSLKYPVYVDSATAGLDTIPQHAVWGWKTADNSRWLTMAKYESAGYFYQGLATFRMDGLMGIVDTTFQEVIPPRYHILLPVRPGFAMALRKSRVDFA
ncbi:MAG TPA: WG repeat-containing protein, partial [Bacteroidia bacterium]|nr:WG repeat-containing protein [Bacteroidia bacterium]